MTTTKKNRKPTSESIVREIHPVRENGDHPYGRGVLSGLEYHPGMGKGKSRGSCPTV